eukprot:353752-Chlamydomonas_euryale.AAC.3
MHRASSTDRHPPFAMLHVPPPTPQITSVVQNGPYPPPLASFFERKPQKPPERTSFWGGGTVPFRTNGRTMPTGGRCVAHTPSPPPNGGGAHATPPSEITALEKRYGMAAGTVPRVRRGRHGVYYAATPMDGRQGPRCRCD